MRNIFAATLITSLLVLTTVFASDQECKSCSDNAMRIIPIMEVTSEMMEEFFVDEGHKMVIELTEGAEVPISQSIDGISFVLEFDNTSLYKIKIHKTCYMKLNRESFLFSADLSTWYNPQNFLTGPLEQKAHFYPISNPRG